VFYRATAVQFGHVRGTLHNVGFIDDGILPFMEPGLITVFAIIRHWTYPVLSHINVFSSSFSNANLVCIAHHFNVCLLILLLCAEVPKLLHLAPPTQDFALIYAPAPGKKHKILYMEHT
jgi:hypothetical protein